MAIVEGNDEETTRNRTADEITTNKIHEAEGSKLLIDPLDEIARYTVKKGSWLLSSWKRK
jgi:hypothetical protein